MSPKDSVRKLLCEWYGVLGMPIKILTREEEEEEFEKAHPEIPKELWEFVAHRTRQALLWCRSTSVDVVIKEGNTYRLVQDICFRENYENDKDWRKECCEWIVNAPEILIAFHEENGINPMYT